MNYGLNQVNIYSSGKVTHKAPNYRAAAAHDVHRKLDKVWLTLADKEKS